ncbi:MAG: hypothetical protein ACNA7E_06165 [Wenzhouxiangellaceae bacterium]
MRIFGFLFSGLLLAGLILLGSGSPAFAHHGWSGNTAGEAEVTGTVIAGVSLAGAHGTMQIRDADGQVWDLTLAPGPRTHRSGLREDVIPVGAEVTVHGERNADPEKFEMKVRRVLWEDREFEVYPPR